MDRDPQPFFPGTPPNLKQTLHMTVKNKKDQGYKAGASSKELFNVVKFVKV